MDQENQTPSDGPAYNAEEGLLLLGQETFSAQDDYHRIVTFLNRCLKDKGIIFGLSKVACDDRLVIRIYETKDRCARR